MPSILTRPSGGGAAFSATVAVSVDNSTPDIGDTIQITATPTGITPTSYLFFSKDSDDVITLIGEQAGNVISWVVSGATGSTEIYVLATDGTDEVYSEPETITVSGLVFDTYNADYGVFSLKQLRLGYDGPLCELRRSSDNALKDFYPDASGNLSLTSEDGSGTSLSTWIGSNDAYLYQVYDQSGNGFRYFQVVNSLQPIVVSSGVVNTASNGLACWTFQANDRMEVPGLQFRETVDIYNIMETSDTLFIQYHDPSTWSYLAQSGSTGTGILNNYGSPTLYVNGSLEAVSTRDDVYNAMNGFTLNIHQGASTEVWDVFRHAGYGGFDLTGDVQMVVGFSDASSNRAAIETLLNAIYTIY
jgi:hypothetical protein